MEISVAWQDYHEEAAEGQRLHFHGCDGQISQDKDEEDEAEDGDFHGLAGLPWADSWRTKTSLLWLGDSEIRQDKDEEEIGQDKDEE